MSTSMPAVAAAATNGHGKLAVQEFTDGKSAVDWFSQSARRLYPHKPGTVLHLTAELGDERLCQRYASGEVKPPAYFLRALLRSEHGWQWLSAVMDGSDAPWWLSLKRSAEIGSDVIARVERG